ncbi:hypothetical protein Tco_0327361 [Tanacetum coccineum]
MSFDDLYNKLRSLELDVRIGHSYGVKVAAAPTHSAFIGAASSGSKLNYSNQQSIVPSVSQTSGRSDSIMECVLHSFVAENKPDQDMIYEDFDQDDGVLAVKTSAVTLENKRPQCGVQRVMVDPSVLLGTPQETRRRLMILVQSEALSNWSEIGKFSEKDQ